MAVNISARETYIFSRNDKAAIRLNYQHWVMNKLSGFNLHPSIPRGEGQLRIADIGAGSGIWATEVVEELGPSAQIEAYDVSPDQFPATGWLPNNVKFVVRDCFKEFEADQLGQLIPFIENMKALLKPGGYLQWFEPDMESVKAISCVPGEKTEATERLAGVMKKPTPDSDHSWVAKLGDTFEGQGLKTTVFTRYPMTDILRPQFCHTQILGYEALCEQLEGKGLVEPAKAAKKHIDEIKEEYGKGVGMAQDFICVVGQK